MEIAFIAYVPFGVIQPRFRNLCPVDPQYKGPGDWKHGDLTDYTNYAGGNLAHKHKTIKFDMLGEKPATKYFQISWTD